MFLGLNFTGPLLEGLLGSSVTKKPFLPPSHFIISYLQLGGLQPPSALLRSHTQLGELPKQYAHTPLGL